MDFLNANSVPERFVQFCHDQLEPEVYRHGHSRPDSQHWVKQDNRITSGVRKQLYEGISPLTEGFEMPRPITLEQHQQHHLHLMRCVLGLRMTTSPFTLVLDDLNQRATRLCDEFTLRAVSRNINVVCVSFEAQNSWHAVQHIAVGEHMSGDQIITAIVAAIHGYHESLVIIDSLHDLVNYKGVDMSVLFDLVAMKHCSTLVGVYHQDIIPTHTPANAYEPQSLDILKHMATTVITCKSLAHVFAAKVAKMRSLPEPTHGLLQGAEGIVECLNANDSRGVVLEAEFRRKSGRTESETYFLRSGDFDDYYDPQPGYAIGILKREYVMLLDQYPPYRSPEFLGMVNAAGQDVEAKAAMETTFSLGLTNKQKNARENVVLPYFDAQKNLGEAGEGGRILYNMGSEDDFDEEEDEI